MAEQDTKEKEETKTEPKATSTKTKKASTSKKSKPKASKDAQVIKMTSLNPMKHIYVPETGNTYKFSQTHPFVLIESEEDVNFILRLDGFSVASPSEVEEHYPGK